MADAFGVAVGVPEAQAELPRLRPNDESFSWLAAALKAHFELEDVEAEKALALVTCRPNFLKTNGMLRARRDRHPVQWSKLSQKIADVFAAAEDAESTAATVEERLNFWLDETALPVEEQLPPAEAKPPPDEEPLPADEPPAEALQPKAVEYTTEERQQRISEVEAFWQHAWWPLGGRLCVGGRGSLAGIRHAQNRIAKKRTRICGKKAKWQRRGHAFGPHLRTQQFLVNDGWPRTRSIDMPCCQKGEKYIVQALQGRIPCRSANVSVGVACEGTRVRIFTLESLPEPALAFTHGL